MNETERLILENQKAIMNALQNISKVDCDIEFLFKQIEDTTKALAPQSMEHGYEKDVAEPTQKSETKSEDKNA